MLPHTIAARHLARLPSSPSPLYKRLTERDAPPHEQQHYRDIDNTPRTLPLEQRVPRPPPASTPTHDDALTLKMRELDLLGLLADGAAVGDDASFWNAPNLALCAPPCGLLSPTLYNTHQRIGLLQFTLFNRIISEKRARFYPRRTTSSNLWYKLGEPVAYHFDDVVLPAQAAQAQVFDLIPAAAFHGEQMATRCQRPDSAISAAAANKSRREAELLRETQRAIQRASGTTSVATATTAAVTTQNVPSVPSPLAPAAAPKVAATVMNARNAFSEFLAQNMREQEIYYLRNPLRFVDLGEKVHLGSSSKADDPAPGPRGAFGVIGRSGTNAGLGEHKKTATHHTAPTVAPAPAAATESSPTSSHSTLDELPTPVNDPFDPFPGIDGRDPRLIALLTNTSPESKEPLADWVCPSCGMHNYGSRVNCLRLECGQTRPRIEPVPSRSALGDPGDWYCDHCGLCNWTRRAFCLRCCPLHPDNIEEAITKGLVHYDDPIIALLGYTDKRARAMRKTPAAGKAHCACFGPHHGTRCPHAGCAVPDSLWGPYVASTEDLIASMPVVPVQPRVRHALPTPGHGHGHGHGAGSGWGNGNGPHTTANGHGNANGNANGTAHHGNGNGTARRGRR